MCQSYHCPAQDHDIINGVSFVAPPKPFDKNPMSDILDLNANWIAVIPYAYTRIGHTNVSYNVKGYQWWGEQSEGIRESIKLAKASGINVLLKPQVYIPGSWPGDLSFVNEDEWSTWETNYENYIFTFVEIAIELHVEAFCIGTEFRQSAIQRPHFWRKLTDNIRKIYSGKITYAANWDDYDKITFWDALDLIGIDAYFPLDDSTTPSLEKLIASWHDIMKNIDQFSTRLDRPIVFTEFGYLSVDGAAGKQWELEKNISSRKINEQAQSIALQALLTTCAQYPCWKGGFLWKWFPNNQGHEGYFDRDYTPQGKRAEPLIRSLYGSRSN